MTLDRSYNGANTQGREEEGKKRKGKRKRGKGKGRKELGDKLKRRNQKVLPPQRRLNDNLTGSRTGERNKKEQSSGKAVSGEKELTGDAQL